MKLIAESYEVERREEWEINDLDRVKRLLKKFCEDNGIEKCNFYIRGEAFLKDKQEELYCLFG